MKLQLPGKALLFGEYGVLDGYPGIVATLPDFYFEFEFSVPQKPSIQIVSDYFSCCSYDFDVNNLLDFSRIKNVEDLRKMQSIQEVITDKNYAFFVSTFSPYKEFLIKSGVNIKILHSFSKDLGFGSSSAIIGGTHLFLFKTFISSVEDPLHSEEFWKRLRISTQLLQGGGSGYDVAAQIASSLDIYENSIPSRTYWKYIWDQSSFVPSINKLSVNGRLGTILTSGFYSDTSSAVRRFLQSKCIIDWAKYHASIAVDFIKSPCRSTIPDLIRKAHIVQKKQGILNNSFFKKLDRLGIPYKALGSGYGDCCWTFLKPEALKSVRNSIVAEF